MPKWWRGSPAHLILTSGRKIVMVQSIQDQIFDLLSKTADSLPEGTTGMDLKRAVEESLKANPIPGAKITLEDDSTQEAGFTVRVEIRLDHHGESPSPAAMFSPHLPTVDLPN